VLDGGHWTASTQNATVTVDATRKAAGQRSLHVNVKNLAQSHGYIVSTARIPLTGEDTFVRASVYVATPLDRHAAVYKLWYKFREGYSLEMLGKSFYETWYNGGGEPDKVAYAEGQVPIGRWSCWEWEISKNDELHFWLDGVELPHAAVARDAGWIAPPDAPLTLGWRATTRSPITRTASTCGSTRSPSADSASAVLRRHRGSRARSSHAHARRGGCVRQTRFSRLGLKVETSLPFDITGRPGSEAPFQDRRGGPLLSNSRLFSFIAVLGACASVVACSSETASAPEAVAQTQDSIVVVCPPNLACCLSGSVAGMPWDMSSPIDVDLAALGCSKPRLYSPAQAANAWWFVSACPDADKRIENLLAKKPQYAAAP